MNTELSPVEELALSIAKCKEIKAACEDKSHPCNQIVRAQEYLGNKIRQSPEPWAGNLAKAPLLFVGSNPSISEDLERGEDFPRVSFWESEAVHTDWPPERIVEFHTRRFDQSRDKPYVRPDAQYLCIDGEYRGKDGAKPGQRHFQKYWKTAFTEANYIFGEEIDISNSICLSEVVHCKTKSETKNGKPIGLEESLSTCVQRYLLKIFEVSPAPLVVLTGAFSRKGVLLLERHSNQDEFSIDIDQNQFGLFPRNKKKADANLGVMKIGNSYKIVCAMSHLSAPWLQGSSFRAALGDDVATAMAKLFQNISKGFESVPKSRDALLNRLLVE